VPVPDTSTCSSSPLRPGAIVVPDRGLYIVAQSIDRGRLAGFVSALGIAVGGLIHVTAAAIGSRRARLFSDGVAAVKYAGAAY
jgi:threonine/homoserine/homoserine lactone efflux protein